MFSNFHTHIQANLFLTVQTPNKRKKYNFKSHKSKIAVLVPPKVLVQCKISMKKILF